MTIIMTVFLAVGYVILRRGLPVFMTVKPKTTAKGETSMVVAPTASS